MITRRTACGGGAHWRAPSQLEVSGGICDLARERKEPAHSEDQPGLCEWEPQGQIRVSYPIQCLDAPCDACSTQGSWLGAAEESKQIAWTYFKLATVNYRDGNSSAKLSFYKKQAFLSDTLLCALERHRLNRDWGPETWHRQLSPGRLYLHDKITCAGSEHFYLNLP